METLTSEQIQLVDVLTLGTDHIFNETEWEYTSGNFFDKIKIFFDDNQLVQFHKQRGWRYAEKEAAINAGRRPYVMIDIFRV